LISDKVECLKCLINDYVADAGVDAFSIGFTLVFDDREQPEVLVGVSTLSEVRGWLSQYASEAKYYIWNTAEYSRYEISYFDDFSYFNEIHSDREGCIEEIQSLIRELNNRIYDSECSYFCFAQDVEDDDFLDFLKKSLCESQLKELMSKSYI